MFGNFLFLASAILSVGGALMVVATRNLMHACIYLLTSLIGVAGLYASLGADFVAATQLVVYVGGVVILMLFAVMLTGGKEGEGSSRFSLEKVPQMGNTKTYVWGGITALVFSGVLVKLLTSVGAVGGGKALPYDNTVEQIGYLLITDHVLAFEISSVLLLGALVGAAIIARPKKENQ